MAQNQVKRRVLQGVGANALSQGVGVMIQLLGLPVFLTCWGVDRYGDWLILSSLVAFLSLSDVGLATAAANQMTICVGGGDREGATSVFQSAWLMLMGVGGTILAGVLVLLWCSPAADYLPLRLVSAPAAIPILTVLAIQVLVVQQTSLLNAGFRCDGNYALGQSLSAVARLLEFLAQTIVVFLVGTMLSVAVAGLLTRCVALLVFRWTLSATSPWLTLGIKRADLGQVVRLAPASLAFLGMPLGHALGNQGLIQVIAATLGSAAVVVYSAHRTIANVVIQMITVINNSVWPEFSTAFGSGDTKLMRSLHRAACKWALWLSLPACLSLVIAAPILLPIWSRGKITIVMPLLIVFLTIILLRSIWRTSSVVHLATNRHKTLATLLVGGNAAACLGAGYLASTLGIVGVAASAAVVDLTLLLYVVTKSIQTVDDHPMEFLAAVLDSPQGVPKRSVASAIEQRAS